jgi:hypothetical protein
MRNAAWHEMAISSIHFLSFFPLWYRTCHQSYLSPSEIWPRYLNLFLATEMALSRSSSAALWRSSRCFQRYAQTHWKRKQYFGAWFQTGADRHRPCCVPVELDARSVGVTWSYSSDAIALFSACRDVLAKPRLQGSDDLPSMRAVSPAVAVAVLIRFSPGGVCYKIQVGKRCDATLVRANQAARPDRECLAGLR